MTTVVAEDVTKTFREGQSEVVVLRGAVPCTMIG